MNTALNSPTFCDSANKLSNADRSLISIDSTDRLDLATQQQRKSIAQIYVEQAKVYYQEQHNWRKVVLACKNALETAPDTADAYRILGDILYRQGKKAEALGIYAKALTIDPNLATVYAKVGTLYLDREDWQKALDYYQQAVILDPDFTEAYVSLAQVWEELGDEEKALECLCRAINLKPTILKPEAYFKFGQELYEQGKIKEASILFIHGVESNPLAKTELSQLVKMLEELEEWKQAVVYYHQLISSSDGSKDNQSKSNCHVASDYKPIKNLLSGSNFSAVEATAKNAKTDLSVLSQNAAQKLMTKIKSSAVDRSASDTVQSPLELPNSAISWNNLGSVYAQQNQWTKAISCYQEAVQLDPNSIESYRNLARVYSQTGEELKAILYWYQSFTLKPDLVKPREYFTLASKLIKYQQHPKAIACLRRAVELQPDFEQAKVTLERLLQKTAVSTP